MSTSPPPATLAADFKLANAQAFEQVYKLIKQMHKTASKELLHAELNLTAAAATFEENPSIYASIQLMYALTYLVEALKKTGIPLPTVKDITTVAKAIIQTYTDCFNQHSDEIIKAGLEISAVAASLPTGMTLTQRSGMALFAGLGSLSPTITTAMQTGVNAVVAKAILQNPLTTLYTLAVCVAAHTYAQTKKATSPPAVAGSFQSFSEIGAGFIEAANASAAYIPSFSACLEKIWPSTDLPKTELKAAKIELKATADALQQDAVSPFTATVFLQSLTALFSSLGNTSKQIPDVESTSAAVDMMRPWAHFNATFGAAILSANASFDAIAAAPVVALIGASMAFIQKKEAGLDNPNLFAWSANLAYASGVVKSSISTVATYAGITALAAVAYVFSTAPAESEHKKKF